MKSPVVKRSIVVAGHKTSVSLEEAFWNGMKEIASVRNLTLSELVGEIDGVRFVNDSKATNAEAADQALKAYRNAYWIAGGVPKAEGIRPLAPHFPNIAKAYLIGDAEEAFADVLKGKVAVQKCGTLEHAVQAAFRDASASGEAHPVILLSPACASFDQFRDFEHRGDVFRSIVQSMMPQELKELA